MCYKRGISWNVTIQAYKILQGICLGCTLQEVCEIEWCQGRACRVCMLQAEELRPAEGAHCQNLRA